MLKVLGVDPGSKIIGFALLGFQNEEIKYISSHILKLKNTKFSKKLSFLLEQFEEYLKDKKPDLVVLEDNFYHKNPKVLLTLGRISGVLIAVTDLLKIPVILYSPAEIKKSVTGSGNASKEQVAYMVKKILKLEGETLSDVTDAISIALCYYYKNNLFEKIEELR